MELRLLKAVTLLRNPTAKIITVAEQCGFNHLGLFNICFKRRFGQSPGQWRKCGAAKEVESAFGAEINLLSARPAMAHGSAKMNAGASQAKDHRILRGMFMGDIKRSPVPPDTHCRATLTIEGLPT